MLRGLIINNNEVLHWSRVKAHLQFPARLRGIFPVQKIVLIHCGSFHITDLIEALDKTECRVVSIPLAEANSFDFNPYRAVVISGGPQLFTDPETATDLIRRFLFIDELTLPILGICLGHQALGIRAGARVYRGEERRTEETIQTVAANALFEGLPNSFSMKTDHCEGISLPDGFETLAFSEYYPVEAMASRRLPHFGVQFHPEISGESGDTVIRNFMTLAGDSHQ